MATRRRPSYRSIQSSSMWHDMMIVFFLSTPFRSPFLLPLIPSISICDGENPLQLLLGRLFGNLISFLAPWPENDGYLGVLSRDGGKIWHNVCLFGRHFFLYRLPTAGGYLGVVYFLGVFLSPVETRWRQQQHRLYSLCSRFYVWDGVLKHGRNGGISFGKALILFISFYYPFSRFSPSLLEMSLMRCPSS